jgi:hypothetical protein
MDGMNKQTKTCACCGQEIKEDVALNKAIDYLRDKDWAVDAKDFKKAIEVVNVGEMISLLYRECDWNMDDTSDVRIFLDAVDLYRREKLKLQK